MPAEPNSVRQSEERLESWKEIASYLKKGVRTVQRWEQTEGLPVRRLGQDRSGFVFAYKSELDAWWDEQSRRDAPQLEAGPIERPDKPRVHWRLTALAAVLMTLAVGGLLWNGLSVPPTPYRLIPLTAEHGSEIQPSFSPDGRQIAYVWIPPGGHPSIYRKTVGADSGVRLTSGADREGSPAWSPDGRFIAFVRRLESESTVDLMLAPAAGGSESQIAELSGPGSLSWSADGKWLIAKDGPLKAKSIVAISLNSGAKHALTKPYEFGYQGAALSSDLHRLVFAHAGPGPSSVYEQELGPDLSPRGEPRVLVAMVWSQEMLINADTREVIYTDGSWEEGFGLFRLRIGPRARPEMIEKTSDHYVTPAVSPDGHRLAFGVIRSYREDTWRLSLSDPGASPTPLLSSTHSDLNPQYSADGRRIAFHSTRSGASDIWIADSEGANLRRLTFTNARTTATPRWSPDDAWIAYESNESGQHEIYVIGSAGGPNHRLTDSPALDAIPSWSRDGKTLYFCSNRTGRFEIWKMPATGGNPTQVTFKGGFSAVESLDGKYLYYTQTRNFGPLLRMPAGGGASEEIVPEIRGLFYAVAAHGVYFQSNRAIFYWDAASRQIHSVFAPAKPMGIGMAVSPDGESLLFTQVDAEGADLYMIDGFR